jgi:putative transposase
MPCTRATTDIAARYETAAAEDLNVAGMLCNRRLARALADQGFSTVVRMLDYKTGWKGGRLVQADRWFPSSKTCSACGAVKAKLPLHVRVFSCEACGLVTNRDENAARNLLSLAASGAERLNACGVAVGPGLAGRAALNQEPGAALAGQTGTAAGQLAAADKELANAH